MKKILYFALSGILASVVIASCDDVPENPGNFDTKSELSVNSVKSLRTLDTQNLEVVDVRDTLYHYPVKIYDPVLDENGDTVFDKDGNAMTTTRTEIMPAIGPKKNGKIYELAPITIDWTQEDYDNNIVLDTLIVNLSSNAKWVTSTADVVPAGASQFYSIINGTNSGGGDGYINLQFTWCRPKQFTVCQPVYTQDSSIVYMLNFEVHGANYPR